jgi:uncharacterized protein with PIN domain
MARFYADENFDYPITEALRLMGHDVLTVQEAAERGNDDGRVLSFATADGRVVLTFNRQDFKKLHRQSTAHGGIVSCTWDRDYVGLAKRIDAAVAAATSLVGQHLRVNRKA